MVLKERTFIIQWFPPTRNVMKICTTTTKLVLFWNHLPLNGLLHLRWVFGKWLVPSPSPCLTAGSVHALQPCSLHNLYIFSNQNASLSTAMFVFGLRLKTDKMIKVEHLSLSLFSSESINFKSLYLIMAQNTPSLSQYWCWFYSLVIGFVSCELREKLFRIPISLSLIQFLVWNDDTKYWSSFKSIFIQEASIGKCNKFL